MLKFSFLFFRTQQEIFEADIALEDKEISRKLEPEFVENAIAHIPQRKNAFWIEILNNFKLRYVKEVVLN